MKKLAVAFAAIAAFTAPALAADMAPRYAKAAPAPVAYVPSWTGCYVGGGVGYGMYNVESTEVVAATGAFAINQGTSGGRGYFGNVQVGCDYQFGGNWVVGAFGDYSFMDVHGDHVGPPATTGVGSLTQNAAWAVGGRIGYLVTPSFLTYFSGGWTQTDFDQVNYNNFAAPQLPNGVSLPGTTYNGWFIGSGFEYALAFMPGLYLKTEYRFSEFDRKQTTNTATVTGLPLASAETVKPYTQSVLTSLVYRFNWGR